MKNFVKKVAATTLSVFGILSAIPSAFCAPEGANNNPAPANNGRGHIDQFNMMVVGKYFDSFKDICHLTMVNRKYGDERNDIMKRYHLNPVAITSKKQLALYPNMETCHIGRCESEEDFISTFLNKKIIELVYLPGSFDANQFEKVVNENKLNNADIWIREFRLESENPMDGFQITFTNKTTGRKIVFMFRPYVDGVLGNLNEYNEFLKSCGIVGKEFAAASLATSGALFIPDSVTSIGDRAFYGCQNLTQVTIPGFVTSIGNHAFCDCIRLTQVTIPNGVTSIGDYVFSGCQNLTQVTIPGSVMSIGNYAFYNCIRLTQVIIPNGVMSMGAGAFYGCKNLTQVNIPSSVTRIGNHAFYDCKRLTQITIQNGVMSIGDYAFYNCVKLTQVTIPYSVMRIGDDAFYGCQNLTQVTIPSSIMSIGNYAFYDCKRLTQVTIQNGVSSIGNGAFEHCRKNLKIKYKDEVYDVKGFMTAFINDRNYNR